MNTIQTLLIFACLAWLSPPSSSAFTRNSIRKKCGLQQIRKTRIVGGTSSHLGKWPWHVSLDKVENQTTSYWCGGVLISEKYVLSAAHCEPGYLTHLVAIFGQYNKISFRKHITKKVEHFIVHPEYDRLTMRHDIAVLELETPVTYDKHIVPICLPDDEDDYEGRMAVVTGWGLLKDKGELASILQEVNVPVLGNKVCGFMYSEAGEPREIFDSFLCAGYAKGTKDACQGDSGGPLKIKDDKDRWILIGTVSHGIGCAQQNLPGVYSRITYYKPWLLSVIGQ